MTIVDTDRGQHCGDNDLVGSVILPCFNGARTIELQLEALATQRSAPPFEVLVIDNRSTDQSARIARQWAPRFSRFRLLEAVSHQGVSYARNVGIGAALCDRLLFCDADDVVSSFWVREGLGALESVELFSGASVPMPDSEFDRELTEIRQDFEDDTSFGLPFGRQDGSAFPILMGGNFGIRREVAIRLGGFDNALPATGEDNDFAIRAQLSGVPVLYAHSSRIAYRQRVDAESRAVVAYRAAKAHALLCARYGLWSQSPHIHGSVAHNLIRTLGASIRLTLAVKPRDWGGLRERWSVDRGLAVGMFVYGLAGRVPHAQYVGVEEGEHVRRLNLER